jgi:hypothetical protein
VEKLKAMKPSDSREDWQITYATPIYGGWDIMVECKFSNLEDLEKIVYTFRIDDELSQWIEATTTLISTRKNYS